MSYEPIEAIPAVAPAPSLTTAARPLPDGVNWRTGVSFRDNGARTHGAWPYAPGAAHDDKVTHDPLDPDFGIASFVPVMLYVPLQCDETTARSEEELLAELRGEIEATSAFSLARTMAGSVGAEWSNDPACGIEQNPTLSQPYPGHAFGEAGTSTGNDVLTGSAGDHPVAVLGALLEAYTALTRKGGATVHVEVRLLPHLLSLGAVTQQGDVYRGPLGSVVVPHFELVGPAADDAGAPTAPTAGNSWMYATGPVQYAMDPARILPEGERWRRTLGAGRTNIWQVVAERLAIVRWNPSVVIAAEALEPVAGV